MEQKLIDILHEHKAKDLTIINTAKLTEHFSSIIVTSGTSKVHVKALAFHVSKAYKDLKTAAPYFETDPENEWLIVDYGDIVIHIMQQHTRDYYRLEDLWTAPATNELIANNV